MTFKEAKQLKKYAVKKGRKIDRQKEKLQKEKCKLKNKICKLIRCWDCIAYKSSKCVEFAKDFEDLKLVKNWKKNRIMTMENKT